MVPGSSLSFSEPQFSYKTAAVHFISKDGVLEFGDLSFEDPTIKRCASEGYKLTSCANGSPAGFVRTIPLILRNVVPRIINILPVHFL